MLVWKIAFRNLFRQKSRSFLCGLSITGSYILFSISLGFADGSYGNLIRLLTENHSGHVQIHHQGYLENPSLHRNFKITPELLQVLAGSREIQAWSGRVYSAALIFGEEKSSFTRIVGIDPDQEARVTRIRNKLARGSYFSGNPRAPEVLLSARLQKLLEVKVGEEVIFIGQGADGSIANDIFTVAGVLKPNAEMQDGNLAYLPLKTAQDFLTLQTRVHEIALRLDDYNEAREQAQILGNRMPDETLTAEPWQVVEEQFYKAMRADMEGNWITQFVILFIVALLILITVLMNTLERQHEFGILLALGTKPWFIFAAIQLEMMMLGLYSVLAGSAPAYGLNWYFSEHGIRMEEAIEYGGMVFEQLLTAPTLQAMVLPAVAAVATATIVALFPAVKAARAVPVEILRKP